MIHGKRLIYIFLNMDTKRDDFADASEVLRVGVRIPPFWPEEPTLWFAQVESQFILFKITSDETKFYYLVDQFDHQYAAEVKDIITNPPTSNKYQKLKTELIRRLSASQERQVKQLLMHEELGDRKPSQFLRHLQSLAGPSVPEQFLATIWSSRLPNNIQTVVASQVDLPLEKLADLADRVHEIIPCTPQFASTSQTVPASQSISPLDYDILVRQVSELTQQVAKLTQEVSRGRKYDFQRERRNNRSRSRSRPRQPPPNHPHCYYHFTFGTKAQKCKQPCSFPSENLQGSRK